MKRFLSGVLVIPFGVCLFFHKDDFHLTAFGTKCSLLSQRKGAQKNLVLFHGHHQINCAFLWGNQLALDIQIYTFSGGGWISRVDTKYIGSFEEVENRANRLGLVSFFQRRKSHGRTQQVIFRGRSVYSQPTNPSCWLRLMRSHSEDSSISQSNQFIFLGIVTSGHP